MKGLMVKDFRILKNQFRFYLVLLVVALFIMIVNDSPFFVVSYVTMIFGLLSITAIGYDEVDNGYSFLFTMPVRRKQYVLQKYMFTCMTTGGAGVASFLLLLIGLAKKGELSEWKEYGFMTVCFVLAVLIYVMFMLPIQLKFGIEKGRMVIIAAMIVIGVGIISGVKMLEEMPELTQNVIELMSRIGDVGVIGILFTCWLVIAVFSYVLAVRVMEKKEF